MRDRECGLLVRGQCMKPCTIKCNLNWSLSKDLHKLDYHNCYYLLDVFTDN